MNITASPTRSATLALLLFSTLFGASLSATAAEEFSSIARGGLLYDKWFKVINAKAPATANPAYPKDGKYYGKKGADWRCKECHGWDYRGKDGSYASGKHATGIKGINAMAGKSTAAVVAVLKDSTHGYGELMDGADLHDLAMFVTKGQLDMDLYIDRPSKQVKGDATKGEGYFNTLCAQCHGRDGKKVKDMDPMGKVVNANPWETLHKVLNGQPGEQMPALRALDIQIAVDTLSYAQTLPTEK